MNKDAALQRGYFTTGSYEFSKTPEMEAELAEIKKSGYKAIIAFFPSSPLSRGHRSGGYGIMVEKRYLDDKTAAEYKASVSGHAARCAAAMKAAIEKANAEIADYERQNNAKLEWLNANGYGETKPSSVS